MMNTSLRVGFALADLEGWGGGGEAGQVSAHPSGSNFFHFHAVLGEHLAK